MLRNPPTDNVPAPQQDKLSNILASQQIDSNTVGIFSVQFALMWGIFFCNILAGISIISFQSPLFQDILRHTNATLSTETLASYGATLIAISALFNGVGRMLWGALSDRIGRGFAFRWILASQLAAFGLLTITSNPWIFGLLVCYVLLCYGGGFGTMPSFVLDVFGPKKMATAYGAILTAWSAAGVIGPQVVAYLKDHFAERAASQSFYVSSGFLALGLILALMLKTKKQDPQIL